MRPEKVSGSGPQFSALLIGVDGAYS